jgi:GNAT superfamily N-acetyltransferase
VFCSCSAAAKHNETLSPSTDIPTEMEDTPPTLSLIDEYQRSDMMDIEADLSITASILSQLIHLIIATPKPICIKPGEHTIQRFQEATMKIYEDSKDQCLLCIGYDFKGDYPLQRELALKKYRDGVKEKEWWRYHHSYLGLKTWVAYQGVEPVGHIECIPVEHAPRPISGEDLIVITCLHVVEKAQNHGVGSALLRTAEEYAFQREKGIAAISNKEEAFMPLPFFEYQGYQPVEDRAMQTLVFKSFNGAPDPTLIPLGYQPIPVKDKVSIVYFHCPQCPKSGWILKKLEKKAGNEKGRVLLQIFNTGDRADVEQLGIAQGVYINGRISGSFPPDPDSLLEKIDQELGSREGR